MNHFEPTDFIELRKMMLQRNWPEHIVQEYEDIVLAKIQGKMQIEELTDVDLFHIFSNWLKNTVFRTFRTINDSLLYEHFIFEYPLEEMPLYINDIGDRKMYALWRLKIGR